jgi:2-polyprenyl-3-methyl-5-hydroxy-6-metoxy-1,4-benzoquinol methylase
MKKAFIILGAESSGTRLLTSIFVKSGFAGSSEHDQPWDTKDPDADKIVWRRSVPHGLGELPDIVGMIKQLRKLQYDVGVVVIHREASATLASQVKSFEAVVDEATALDRYQKAYLYIYDSIRKAKASYLVVTYESLYLNQVPVLDGLNKYFDIDLEPQEVRNENAKWYKPLRPAPMYTNPISCLCTQDSMETAGYKYLCEGLLKEVPSFHRKQWEFAYILEMLNLHGKLKPGMRGLGFGCGKERLVPAMAALGVELVVTDLDFVEAQAKGWTATNQHSSNLDSFKVFCPHVCSEEQLLSLQYRTVDMNKIPQDLMTMGFDFVWSSCSLEHVGSLAEAKRFIYSTAHCLKPGGVAVHTTEFNLSSNDRTLESGPTVLFRKKDVLEVQEELKKLDALMYPPDFNPGDRELDKYIDLPPYLGSEQRRHLKLQVDEYNCTSIGICFRRRP